MSIRTNLINQRKSLPTSEQKAASHEIVEKAKKIPFFQESQLIAFYKPINGEVNCNELIEYAWQQNKTVLLPVLTANFMKFVSYEDHHVLVENHYGIKEPVATPENTYKASDLDLVFVPLVGFDTQKNRLGMGKGYYDKTFSFRREESSKSKKPFLVGLAYGFQKVDEIHTHPWDVSLDMVITEKAIY